MLQCRVLRSWVLFFESFSLWRGGYESSFLQTTWSSAVIRTPFLEVTFSVWVLTFKKVLSVLILLKRNKSCLIIKADGYGAVRAVSMISLGPRVRASTLDYSRLTFSSRAMVPPTVIWWKWWSRKWASQGPFLAGGWTNKLRLHVIFCWLCSS